MRDRLLLGLGLVLAGGGAGAQPQREAVIEASSWVSNDEGDQAVEDVSTPGLERRLYAVPDQAIVIPEALLEQATLASLREDPRPGKRLLASVHVPVAMQAAAGWQRIAASRGPSSWRLAILSEGASFLRPHFVDFPSKETARVVVYGGSPDQSAVAVRPTRSARGPGVWGPLVEGPVLFVEVITASGARPSLVVDVVSNGIPRARRSGTDCNLDPTCYGTWSPIKSGIGRLYFEDGGSGWVCSGSLLTDRSHTGKPYFLTAHHCVNEQAVADTAVVFWNYHTSACNGLVPSLGSVPRTAGSAVLATSESTDFTLLLLDGGPPGGTAFLGWTTQALAAGAPIAMMHHPAGDWKRISFGQVLDSRGDRAAGQKFWLAGFTRGAVEGGSSGAPLFSPSQQVIGQLLGASGMGICNDPKVINEFGKLGVSWSLGLSKYLNQ